jgi:DNA repair protein RadA
MSNEEIESFDISITQLEGLGAVTAKKLAGFGITNLYDLAIHGARELQELTGSPEDTVRNWVLKAKAMLEEKGLIRDAKMDVEELLDYQNGQDFLKVNVPEIDELFDGGLEREAMYEVYGEFGSGKTQFCLSATVEAICNGDHVLWFDCEDTFKPKRLVEIIIARGYATDLDDVREKGYLKNIKYIYTPNSENFEIEFSKVTEACVEWKPRMVVVDGIVGQYAEEYIGRGTLSARQNKLRRAMTHMKNLSYYFKCIVIFTNQVQADPSVMFGDPTKPIGGNVVGHASTYRVYFKKSGKRRIARMVDSPKGAINDVEYVLGVSGIEPAT